MTDELEKWIEERWLAKQIASVYRCMFMPAVLWLIGYLMIYYNISTNKTVVFFGLMLRDITPAGLVMGNIFCIIAFAILYWQNLKEYDQFEAFAKKFLGSFYKGLGGTIIIVYLTYFYNI